MQQETGELKESEVETAEFETLTEDDEVKIPSQDRSRETSNFPDTDIRDEETLSNTQQEDWLLPTESLHGTHPRQTGRERPPVIDNWPPIRDYISGSLGVDDSIIALRNIYRVGKRGQNHKRPILLNFQSSDDRQRVWKAKLRPPNATDVSGDNPSSNEDNRENRKSSGVFMTQDYPVEIQSRRRRLIPIFKKAKSMEDYRNDTYIHHDKLTIKGVTYTVNNIHTLPRELNPVMLSTRRDGDTIFFWSANSPFSNHHPCVFVCDDVRYNCSEQYYMHQMAIKANDTQRANAIMEADDPVTQKHIARDVVKPKEWIKLASAVMMNGLRAKFLQNPTLSDYLTKTKDYQLAEASPYDTYWGIGLSFDSPVKSDAQNWKGKNQLGRLLVDLREEILKPTET